MTKQEKIKLNAKKDLNKTIPIDKVWDTVVDYFNIDPDLLRSKTNRREIIVPRHVFFYLCKKYTNATLSHIGRYASNENFDFDHSTVHTAIKKINSIIDFQIDYRMPIECITEILDKTYKQ